MSINTSRREGCRLSVTQNLSVFLRASPSYFLRKEPFPPSGGKTFTPGLRPWKCTPSAYGTSPRESMSLDFRVVSLPTNPVPLPPRRGRFALCLTFISYVMSSISENWPPPAATPYPASPDFPRKRWQNKPQISNCFISISRRSAAKTSPSGGGAAAGGRRGAFPAPVRAMLLR